MNCNEFRTQLESWLGEALASERREHDAPDALREHARGCSGDCRARLDAAKLVLTPERLRTTPPDDLADRVKARLQVHRDERDRARFATGARSGTAGGRRLVRFAMAAALVAALVIGVLLGRGFPGLGTDELVAGRSDADASGPDDRIVRMEFRLEAPGATAVAVVGDWNEWNPQVHPLVDDGDGVWTTTITLRLGEEYQYQFLIDDERWIPDPSSSLAIDDGFGGTNSVLNI